jgi:hypothetical protein
VQQLENQLANLAHCKIGAAGAVPLAAALSAQNSIVALDLRDNGLDGKVRTTCGQLLVMLSDCGTIDWHCMSDGALDDILQT